MFKARQMEKEDGKTTMQMAVKVESSIRGLNNVGKCIIVIN